MNQKLICVAPPHQSAGKIIEKSICIPYHPSIIADYNIHRSPFLEPGYDVTNIVYQHINCLVSDRFVGELQSGKNCAVIRYKDGICKIIPEQSEVDTGPVI